MKSKLPPTDNECIVDFIHPTKYPDRKPYVRAIITRSEDPSLNYVGLSVRSKKDQFNRELSLEIARGRMYKSCLHHNIKEENFQARFPANGSLPTKFKNDILMFLRVIIKSKREDKYRLVNLEKRYIYGTPTDPTYYAKRTFTLIANIGKILGDRRRQLKLKQKEVCEETGMCQQILSLLENNRHTPTIKTIGRLSKILKYSLIKDTEGNYKIILDND